MFLVEDEPEETARELSAFLAPQAAPLDRS
jgi:hypothetical protein